MVSMSESLMWEEYRKAGQLVPLNSVLNIELALAHWFLKV